MLIDSHAHLTSKGFANCLDGVLQRAVEAGVSRVVSIACDLDDSRATVALASIRSEVVATIGVHPCYVGDITVENWKGQLADLVDDPSVVAIGETGLDYFHQPPPGWETTAWRKRQAEFFEAQLDLAQASKLPVVVHQRESGDDVLAILEKFPGVTAVLHCFTGTIRQAERAFEMGHWVSFTGVVTYPKAEEVRDVARMTPSDRFMLETDCPYLAPAPHRGEKNEPSFLVHTAAKVAETKNLSLEECSNLTTENAYRFFNKLRP